MLNGAEGVQCELLKISLGCAVPLWALRIRDVPWRELIERARKCGQVVAEHGNLILFRGEKGKGSERVTTADAFNALAEGLAILSFVPGGVRFLGLEWKNQHEEAGSVARDADGIVEMGVEVKQLNCSWGE